MEALPFHALVQVQDEVLMISQQANTATTSTCCKFRDLFAIGYGGNLIDQKSVGSFIGEQLLKSSALESLDIGLGAVETVKRLVWGNLKREDPLFARWISADEVYCEPISSSHFLSFLNAFSHHIRGGMEGANQTKGVR